MRRRNDSENQTVRENQALERPALPRRGLLLHPLKDRLKPPRLDILRDLMIPGILLEFFKPLRQIR